MGDRSVDEVVPEGEVESKASCNDARDLYRCLLKEDVLEPIPSTPVDVKESSAVSSLLSIAVDCTSVDGCDVAEAIKDKSLCGMRQRQYVCRSAEMAKIDFHVRNSLGLEMASASVLTIPWMWNCKMAKGGRLSGKVSRAAKSWARAQTVGSLVQAA